jgi:hypothetical protein
MLSLTTFFFMSACKQRKQIQRANAENKTIIPASSFSLYDSLKIHSFNYKTLSAKINTNFKSSDGNEIGLMITMRAIHDSAIWMSASPALGIEAARILFTRDSIKIMDKINGQYAMESYSFLKKFSEADISFDMLQNILMGNAAFLDADVKTDSITKFYMAHCFQSNLLEELTATRVFRIMGNIIIDKFNQDKINITYSDMQFVEYEYLPFHTKIETLSNGKSATILLNYSNVAVNLPVEIKFNIPSSYTKMNH